MRTVIRFLSSAKIAGMPSQVWCEGSGGIQYTPSSVKRSIQACHFCESRSSAWRYRSCSTSCCRSWPASFPLARLGTGFLPGALMGAFFLPLDFVAISLLRGHVPRPGLHLVAHRRLRGAAAGRGLDHAVLLNVATVVAREGAPIAALRGQALVAFPEVLQVVGVDQRGRGVDEVVVGERAAVDRLGRALQAEVPDLGEGAVDAERAHRAQLLQRRLHREAGVDEHVVDVDADDLLEARLPVRLDHQLAVGEEI